MEEEEKKEKKAPKKFIEEVQNQNRRHCGQHQRFRTPNVQFSLLEMTASLGRVGNNGLATSKVSIGVRVSFTTVNGGFPLT